MPINNTNFHRIWTIEWFLWTQLLRQILIPFEQLNGFSPLWVHLCIFQLSHDRKLSSHLEQLNGFLTIVSSYMDLWTQLWTQIFAAFEQLNGFSPLWVHKWTFKLSFERKFSSHLEQLNGFPHSEFIYGSLNPVINSNFRCIWTTEWFLTIVSS